MFPESRQDALAAAIGKSMARNGSRTQAELAIMLDAAPRALDDLVGELTVPESFFFRTPEQFEFLRREVLPEIVARRGVGHRLRLLSAACAGGEEPYSLAILLEEEGLAASSQVIAADISRPALARALKAGYSEWSLRGTSAEFRSRYFRREDALFKLLPRLRERVELAYLNLAEDSYPSHATGIAAFDVIFCRNALIYFSVEMVARVAARLHASLADGGWLVTSPSDPPLSEHAPFETMATTGGVLYRRRGEQPRAEPAEILAVQAEPAVPRTTGLTPAEREAPAPVRRQQPVRPAPPPAADPGPEAAIALIRASANGGRLHEGLAAAEAAAHRFPLAPGVRYLQAVLFAEAGRDRDAANALRRTLYLDRTLSVAALLLGLVLRRLGDRAGAARALRNARSLLAQRPAGEEVALADGDRAGRLLLAVEAQLRLLEGEAP